MRPLLPHDFRFPARLRYNAIATEGRGPTIVDALGGRCGEQSSITDASAAVEAFLVGLPVPRRLREIAIAREDLGEVAAAVFTDWFISRNPRPVSDVRTLVEILQAAW